SEKRGFVVVFKLVACWVVPTHRRRILRQLYTCKVGRFTFLSLVNRDLCRVRCSPRIYKNSRALWSFAVAITPLVPVVGWREPTPRSDAPKTHINNRGSFGAKSKFAMTARP